MNVSRVYPGSSSRSVSTSVAVAAAVRLACFLLFGLFAITVASADDAASTCGLVCRTFEPDSRERMLADLLPAVRKWLDAGAPSLVELSSEHDADWEFLGNYLGLDGFNDRSQACVAEAMGFAVANFVMLNTSCAIQEKQLSPWLEFILIQWEDSLRCSWPVFELVALWAAKGRDSVSNNQALRSFSDEHKEFWNSDVVKAAGVPIDVALRNATSLLPSAARLAAFVFLERLTLKVGSNSTVFDYLDVLVTSLLLSIANEQPLLNTGYALRQFQSSLVRTFHQMSVIWDDGRKAAMMLITILGSLRWPIFGLIAEVAAAERLRVAIIGDIKIEYPIREGDENKSLRFDIIPPAFVPVADGNAQVLADVLRIATTFFEIAGIDFFAIAGTLLGALRHLDRIPWDDDVDLCVDASVEARVLRMVLAEEALRAGIANPPIMNELTTRERRGLAYLTEEGCLMQIKATRSLVVRFTRMGFHSGPSVDTWFCHDRPDLPNDEMTLMSDVFGPRIPKSAIFPLRKMHFGDIALWAPSDPMEVTRLYFQHASESTDVMHVCAGKKEHAANGQSIKHIRKVPCESLKGVLPFASPWYDIDDDVKASKLLDMVQKLVKNRMPGFDLKVSSLNLSMAFASEVSLPRFTAKFIAEMEGCRANDRQCEALLWGVDESRHLLTSSADGPMQIRSLICRTPRGENTFVWEDAWSWM
eukprot:TRINITY_DN76114_c0_g1_i1.p1 TRINITY_DN76114_c0_g1~~TRINITY_DN76114_c0_g1_i1.p1  ORF type:complete len:702 (-),score=91.68 TRINITY_DN76114_c0_g1_i1:56-2161(-)